MTLQNTIIVVNDEPYCIWEVDLEKRNLEFIEGIDVDYFEYLLNLHLNAEDEKRAAIALRITLHHAVETFFSLLGAYIQAPDCAYAWVAKCHTEELRSLIKKVVDGDQKTFTKLNIDPVSLDICRIRNGRILQKNFLPNFGGCSLTSFWMTRILMSTTV